MKAESFEIISAWKAASSENRTLATDGLKVRLENRGRSVNGAQFVMALVAAAEVAFIAFVLTVGPELKSHFMVAASIPALLGFIAILIGIIPERSELKPRYREDEAMEALSNSDQVWFQELANRSMHQRYVLWRGRVWLAISIIFTVMTVTMVIAAVIVYLSGM